ncbi:hypothetical protein PTSG_12718 [Salpingoeca rosetta]|uniref:DUF4062 domain-containing protein n=1 Tax=Salpingoeca rosetta (strain ATCC 50818 / BSB-021) TaxID=946362 RepID=F2UJJ6_SALR5|nr:uncharacterized protein PTSG_12718 [Salpingoeca rosetta]EGD77295.1 hypothetical protein PTSG_12718 [Salpingoeca rosetta]|eukprot:XP_004990639.1 hypothetical protein PTSG_12718 [Salpingoeca rosetta]
MDGSDGDGGGCEDADGPVMRGMRPLLRQASIADADEGSLTRQSSSISSNPIAHRSISEVLAEHRRSYMPETGVRSTPSTQERSLRGDAKGLHVFVCSSFKDMKDERIGLMTNAFPPIRKLAADKGIFCCETDLRWGVSKEADMPGVIATCLREVRRCSPYIIVLLGDRYGWCPPREALVKAHDQLGEGYWWLLEEDPAAFETTNLNGSTWSGALIDEEGKVPSLCSITHLEIISGVLLVPPAQRRALVFVREPRASAMPTPTLPKPAAELGAPKHDGDGDGDTARARLEALKATLKSSENVDVQSYSSVEDLCQKVKQGLWRFVELDFRKQGLYADPVEQETFLHLAFAASRLRHFRLFEPHARVLEDITACTSHCVLCGPSGIGKSSLFSKLHQVLLEAERNRVILHFVGRSNDSALPSQILRRIAVLIKRMTGESFNLAPQTQRLVSQFPQILSSCSSWLQDRGEVLTIIIDAVNQFTRTTDIPSVSDWLPLHVTFPNIKFVVSTMPVDDVAAMRGANWRVLTMPDIPVAERKPLVNAFLRPYGKQLDSVHVDRLVQHNAARNPLFLRLVLDELRVIGDFDMLDQQLTSLLAASNVSQLYTRVLQRLEDAFSAPPDIESVMRSVATDARVPDTSAEDIQAQQEHLKLAAAAIDAYGLVPTALMLIAVSRHGLMERELISALALPPVVTIPLLHALEESMTCRMPRIMFDHEALRRAVASRYLDTDQRKQAIHALLAAFFATLPKTDPRRLEELPWHLLQCEQHQRLVHYLTDLDVFVAMRATDLSKLELGTHWRELGNELLAPYRQALLDQLPSRPKTEWAAIVREIAMLLFSAGKFEGSMTFLLLCWFLARPPPWVNTHARARSRGAVGGRDDGGSGGDCDLDRDDDDDDDGDDHDDDDDDDDDGDGDGTEDETTKRALLQTLLDQATTHAKKLKYIKRRGVKDDEWRGGSHLDVDGARDLAETFKCIAKCCSQQDNHNMTVHFLKMARTLVESAFGSASLDVAMIYDELAWTNIRARNFDAAWTQLHNSLVIKLKALYAAMHRPLPSSIETDASLTGDEWDAVLAQLTEPGTVHVKKDYQFAVTINRFANCSSGLAERKNANKDTTIGELYDLAEKLHETARLMQENEYGHHHPYVATACHDLGHLFKSRYAKDKNPEHLERALDHWNRALTIRETAFGPHHHLVATTCFERGRLLVEAGQRERGTALLQRAYDIRSKVFGPRSSMAKTVARALSRGSYRRASQYQRDHKKRGSPNHRQQQQQQQQQHQQQQRQQHRGRDRSQSRRNSQHSNPSASPHSRKGLNLACKPGTRHTRTRISPIPTRRRQHMYSTLHTHTRQRSQTRRAFRCTRFSNLKSTSTHSIHTITITLADGITFPRIHDNA